MDSKNLEDQIFLFSSNTDNPEKFFQGYCFVGSDYVFGAEGERQYYEDKGNKIRGGEDGCYITAERRGNAYYFSSDFSGNKKIFYYWSPSFWVVSNSVFLIAEHLKKSGIALRVNYPQLAAIGVEKGSFFNQLYSTNTLIEGVNILPTGCSLEISSNSYSINPEYRKTAVENYVGGMSSFVNTWVSRISGLLASGIDVQSDLTGGADSRTVFTLLKKASEIAGQNSNLPMLRSGSTPGNDKDLKIAKQIADAYGFPINQKARSTINRFSGEESYYSWKTLCLGVYHPVYFPNSGPQPNRVGLGGAGAENHRPFYKNTDVHSLKMSNASKICPNWLSYNFISEMDAEIERIKDKGTSIDPLIMHYREYRNRMHSGRSPQYSVLFNPLGSSILDEVSEVAGNERIKHGQINYDLMASLLPSILDIPFDSETKAFNEVRKKNLASLTELTNINPGKVYGTAEVTQESTAKTKPAMQLLYEDFQNSKKKPFAQDFFGTDFIKRAEVTISNAVENKKFPHAIDGQCVAAIIAAGIFE